jgi:hypothetical protein
MARFLLFGLVMLTAGFLGTTSTFAQTAPKPDFGGNYELAGHRTDRAFFLGVKLDGRRAKVSFSAVMADGTGAAPDAEGTGKLEDGVLKFKFKDSFDNEGTCKLQYLPDSELYQLDMLVTKVVESSPLHFYGTLQLKKVAEKTAGP